ncbi:MAG: TrmH family RNA methyltransferase [Treponema sp.]|nr:TrmH family RNA methyltransferase [Treponema sp.]
MIDPERLFQLEPGQKRRKLALTFGELERDIAGIAEKGTEYNFTRMSRRDYTKAVCRIVLDDPKLPGPEKRQLSSILQQENFDERRACNVARNALLGILGTVPAEWDLVVAPHRTNVADSVTNGTMADGGCNAASDTGASGGTVAARKFFPGVSVYAEDIRSPFNIGSIFRTAEAMGCEKVYISPLCVDPSQSRAVRSGMGCVETMGWTRCPLDELPKEDPVFVLETGGTPITEFSFPEKGIVIIGSEELGVSPEALRRADYGCVSIPMTGLKASLNVGVAFGILMQAWVERLPKG